MSSLRRTFGAALAALAVAAAGGGLLLALAGCGNGENPSTEASGTTTPKAKHLIARSSDFPDGFIVASAETGPTTLADALDGASSPRHGAAIRAERVEGYEVLAENVDRFQGIYCTATVYRSIAGAERVFRLGNEDASAQADREGWTLKRTTIDESLGDEMVAFVGNTAEGQMFTVLWRNGQVISDCGGAGVLVAQPPVEETVLVAHAQHKRIAEALG